MTRHQRKRKRIIAFILAFAFALTSFGFNNSGLVRAEGPAGEQTATATDASVIAPEDTESGEDEAAQLEDSSEIGEDSAEEAENGDALTEENAASEVTAESGDVDEADTTEADDADLQPEEFDKAESDGVEEEQIPTDDSAKTFVVDEPGTDYSITIHAPEGSLPYPRAELSVSVREIAKNSAEYLYYLGKTADALDREDTDTISFARFFDIEILHNGEKVEPLSPVEVKIAYDRAPELAAEDDLSVVHFADAGTEVIDDVQVNRNATEIVYEQGSFSVTATIITTDPPQYDGNPHDGRPNGNSYYEQGKPYVLVVKKGNDLFAVGADGTLTKVDSYVEASGNFVTEDIFAWTHYEVDGSPVLKCISVGYDYGSDKQATEKGYTYIDPSESDAIIEDIVVSVEERPGQEPSTKTTLKRRDDECKLVFDYTNGIIMSATSGKYLTVNSAGTKIAGGADAAGDARFFLAQPDKLPAFIHNLENYSYGEDPYPFGMMRNHQVNHIDISIQDTVTAKIPLAYGTYYDKDGKPVLTVGVSSPESDKTLTVEQDFEVSQQHLRAATIETFKRNEDGTPGAKLNDQFIVTGYSSNNATDISTNQVRLEGIFKVSYNDPIPETFKTWELNNDENRAARLANRTLYKITAIEPDVEFQYVHPVYGQLYDAKGNALSATGDVKVESTFDYFDPRNECPPLYNKNGANYNENGSIINSGTSGMDFVLGGNATLVDFYPVAIEITNDLRDSKGNIIKPKTPIDNIKFNVIQDVDTPDHTTVAGKNINSYKGDTVDLSAYDDNAHSINTSIDKTGTGLVYDYDVIPGMVYVEEDISTVPKVVEDEDGNIWLYRYSYIETDYVDRDDGHKNDLHVSDTYDTGMNTSMPEILGPYNSGVKDHTSDFVEFYSHNVYDKIILPEKQEVEPYVGKGKLEGVNAGDEITYKIAYTNYCSFDADVVIKDTLDEHVEFVSASDGGINSNGTVTWTLNKVSAGTEGFVTLTVKVLDSALTEEGGPGKVVNGGESSTVKIGNDPEYTLDEVENPVSKPHKKETAPYEGTGVLGEVKVGDEITYEISYKNYKKTAAAVEIKDQLDKNVEFVSASNGGVNNNGVVTWNLTNVAAGKTDKVTLTVKVLEGALEKAGGPGKVVNGGETATVKVGNDKAVALEYVENPVDRPSKKESAPYEGKGVLGVVRPGDEITYEITYKNYKNTAADVVIKDRLDKNVEFVRATNGGVNSNGTVTWTFDKLAAGKGGTVSLTVRVLDSALESAGGPGKVVNGGETATVKVGNDPEVTLDTVENPVDKPEKKEMTPYEGNGELGAVKVGDEITYEISYKNYKDTAANVVITDQLDGNVSFVDASDNGVHQNGVVTWNLTNIPAGKSGKVTLTVKVLEGALTSKGDPGKVVNGGETATVKVGNDPAVSLDVVENPVDRPTKKETAPYEGTGVLGAVSTGDEITYEISYKNYKNAAADVVIKDKLDRNVSFVSASNGGTHNNGTVTWNLANVAAGKSGKVTLTVKVLDSALEEAGGPGKVVNGGTTTTVKVGNDPEVSLDVVENPVDKPTKKEIRPYEGNGVLGGVQVGDEITYEISYKNYKETDTTVVIKDKLDKNVSFVSASDGGRNANGTVTWTLNQVAAGTRGTVTLTVKVLEGALEKSGGPGKVVNGGETATVKVGNDPEVSLDEVENPVAKPEKKEVTPYEGTGVLGAVQVGDEITYQIEYKNYKNAEATVVIKDKLDENVSFVSASEGGKHANGTVTWTLKNVEAGKTGQVLLTVKVLEGALSDQGGPGKVANGGETATVKVGNDPEVSLDVVENPLNQPTKKEIKPYEGTGILGGLSVGDEVTYEIAYRNYKETAADVVIKDMLDQNVSFVKASDGGVNTDGIVNWTIKNVAAGKSGKVTLTVKVLEGALEANKGPGKIVNGGETATVKIGNDPEVSLNEVENPVNMPKKKELTPYEGTGVLGSVEVGNEITYEIEYKNYKNTAADVTIKDQLDKNVSFVSASNGGENKNGTVNWTIRNVPAGKTDRVTLTVKVLEGALEKSGGPGKVVNGGETSTVKVGNDTEVSLDEVENPVGRPSKKELTPYEGTGMLGGVRVGDEITYEIEYKNYKNTAADVVIKDQLDKNVSFVSASNGGVNKNGTVNWTIKNVAAGKTDKVTLTVKVLEGALEASGGPGKVVNGGKTATVKVGNDAEASLDVVENPVIKPEKKETSPYKGTGVLGGVEVGDEITYEITYKNYKDEAADVTIKDQLDKNVSFVNASDGGVHLDKTVIWTLKNVAAGKSGKVTLTVKVLKSALTENGGPDKVVNGGKTATVKIGNDAAYTLDVVENPVSKPSKKEIKPYKGSGVLGGVKVGDKITYEITYKNYKNASADVVIKDKLDQNVSFVSASDGGTNKNGTVTWTIAKVPAGNTGKVTLTVKVLEGALFANGGPDKVVNGGKTSTVKVGNDPEVSLEIVENPVVKPSKKETSPYKGTGVLGGVKVGDEITYEIAYKNYKTEAADVVIRDQLDKNVSFVSASDGGVNRNGTVVWTLADVAAGKSGKVSLTVKVLSGALSANGGPGRVVNGGKTATVKVGNDPEVSLDIVENPVIKPVKKEISPYKGRGILGGVRVGQEITYEISYENYKSTAANVTVKDQLDKNVSFVEASDGGVYENGTVIWKFANVAAGKSGKVSLTVKVLSGALEEQGGPGKVVNGGKTATVKIGNDAEYTLDKVENPVAKPSKKEISPYAGNGLLGEVSVGDLITYEISYKNYKTEATDIVIRDMLDKNASFVRASDKGVHKEGLVTWTLKNVPAGKNGKVTLTVKVLEGALKSNGGPGSIVNGGLGNSAHGTTTAIPTATVKVGEDPEVPLELVENPVKEPPVPENPPVNPPANPPTTTSNPPAAKTGDRAPVKPVATAMLLAGAGIILMARLRKRSKKD